MSKINILTSDIYNLISAGEVVVSPSSLVKELVENSIDAKANNIRIEIYNGGISQIIVKDDGEGIEKSEVEKAFIKHATSKIATKEDIFNIKTMGFRGEALYSIALVSNLCMTTRSRNEDTGTKLELEGGEIVSKEEVSVQYGTTIEVTKLFFNTPARYKFLKTSVKEYKDIYLLVANFILAHPNIQFELIVDGQTRLRNTVGELESAVFSVYGSEFATNMIKINEKYQSYRLEGVIGLPTISKSNHSWQTVFVNNRLVESDEIAGAINAVYHDFLMKGRFPCFVVNLIVPYDEVDVNVSPQKTQVKLINSTAICNWLYQGLREILVDTATQEEVEDMQEVENEKKLENSNNDLEVNPNLRSGNQGVSFKDVLDNNESYIGQLSSTNEIISKKAVLTTSRPSEINELIARRENAEIDEINKLNSPTAIKTKIIEDIQKLKENALLRVQALSEQENDCRSENAIFPEFKMNESQNFIKSSINNSYINKNISHLYTQSSFFNENNKVLGVLFNTYIIVENKEEFFLIDQHAVHEKFLFDKFMSEIENSEVMVQELAMPYKFEVNASEKGYVLDNQDALKKLGIVIHDFGQNSLIIVQIPTILADVPLNDFVSELLSDLTIFSKDKIAIKNKIATRACKNAIKAGDVLSEDEIEKILNMVKNSSTPLLCPHGRPYVVKITKNQVEKWFKRVL